MTEQKGLIIERELTGQRAAYDHLTWEKGEAKITNDKGEVLYTQTGIEFPTTWGGLPRNIVASKYFYGENGTAQRESSVKQLIDRVTGKIASWGAEQGYMTSEQAANFQEELKFATSQQMMAFNSPVWFNVGVDGYLKNAPRKNDKRTAFHYDPRTTSIQPLPPGTDYLHPQTSACFIQSVRDTMEDIMQLAYNEAMLFKYGSGTGTDLSTLRSSREKLSGGGIPSGPLAYLLFYDKVAGIVKSGGKTRRAAKMNSLRTEHPDIMEFVRCKTEEQKKLETLMDHGGLSYAQAESTVGYQNANLSIRASDAFMRAVDSDREWQTIPVHSKDLAAEMPRFKARELLRAIAEGTHVCGDPGMQYHDTINKWHTCPVSAPINASNPCSEYMFVDNSSCNLASLNLLKYIDASGKFDVEKFSKVVRLTAIAQDLLYDGSSFPTKEIAENSHNFRPLGMGYANLGALEMFLGLPYDSDEARATAAAITALMTAKVYETSSEMAEKVGTFPEFEKNKEPMLRVIGMHREALKGIDKTKLPAGLESVLVEAEKTWANVEERGRLYGFRNAQATVLAPTGTIGFMMGCDTTGIEPESWLAKTKTLSDGGIMPIVNETVPYALKKLGYNTEQIEKIEKHLKDNFTIEGAPELKEEHLAVFDCAYKTKGGKRCISYQGHLKMMAAVQPFLSGAISKTVGLPHEVTIDEIESVYTDAWKMGLKAVALYRDGSKRMQPLSSGGKTLEGKVDTNTTTAVIGPVRRKLPGTCNSIRHKFSVAGHEGYMHVGMYKDGKPGELFIGMSKEGSTIGGLMDTIGTSISLGLQYGVPLKAFVKKFKGQKFDPRGMVEEGHPEIHTSESLVDYIFEFLERTFPEAMNGNSKTDQPEKTIDVDLVDRIIATSHEKKGDEGEQEELGGFCVECGTQMLKKGHCIERCPKCGWFNPRGCGE